MVWNRLLDRMVERAMPPYVEESEHRRIAEEAAENGIRQTARVASIAGGGVLLVVIAAMLYWYLPTQLVRQGPSEIVGAARQVEAEDTKLRQATEEAEKPLHQVTKERDTLQGKVTDPEGQVAELITKLQAARAPAAPKEPAQPAKQTSGPTKRSPVLTSRPSTYECGDGRSVPNPAECKPTSAAAPGLFPSAPSTYQCGDGRTVRNPAECRATGAAGG